MGAAMKFERTRFALALPLLAAAAAVAALAFWFGRPLAEAVSERLPGADQPPGAEGAATLNPVLAGKLIPGQAGPTNLSALPGLWPQFRGPNRDGISPDTTPLARSWEAAGPRLLWGVDCGEGYAGVVVRDGRVYLMDYDYTNKQNALRCLSLADGGEVWRYAYNLQVKRNHGMTRTVPALAGQFVVAMDPKCHVLCLDAATGELRWGMNLVSDYGATVPLWYAGQCPLIDGESVILAPGGHDALLAAVELATGKLLWRAPNPHGWKMTHSSVMPMEFGGRKFYVYCGSGGVAGISATDGALLWETTAWKISIATVPSPLVLEGGKVFLSGGYNAGSMLLQLQDQGGKLVPEVVWKLGAGEFGATQQTPIFHDGHIFGTRPNGQFVCLGLDGKVAWASPPVDAFGRSPYLLADGLFFVMSEEGKLSMMENSSARCKVLAQAQVLKNGEAWGPMALAGGRLLARDLTRLVCLDVSAASQPK
jgi:outer membrane protein assembly factor BamB